LIQRELRWKVEAVESRATPASVEEAVESLLREGEGVGGGLMSL
jgi:hypothetical protein